MTYDGGQSTLALPDMVTALPGRRLQTFLTSGVPAPIPDNDSGGAQAAVVVSDSAVLLGLTVGVEITHPYIGDLQISLVAPGGDTLVLAERRGGSGNNYAGVIFDDKAARAIATSLPPFSGSYRPEQPLGVLIPRVPAGTWTLKVVDMARDDSGTLDGFWVTTETSSCTVAQYFFPFADKFIDLQPLE